MIIGSDVEGGEGKKDRRQGQDEGDVHIQQVHCDGGGGGTTAGIGRTTPPVTGIQKESLVPFPFFPLSLSRTSTKKSKPPQYTSSLLFTMGNSFVIGGRLIIF